MDPFTIAGMVSGGLGVMNSLMAPDPDEENMRRYKMQQQAFDQRMNQATAAQTQWKGFYDDAMAELAPQLAWAQRQKQQAGSSGAKQAQANVRRSLGANPFGEAIAAGIQTGADDAASSLRALATSDAISQAQRMAQARAGLIANSPMAQMPSYTGAKSMMTTAMLGNLGTTLGAYGSEREKQGQKQSNGTGGSRMDLIPGNQLFGG